MGHENEQRHSYALRRRARFHGHLLNSYHHGGLTLSEFNYPSFQKLPNHSHELAFFSLILAGDLNETFGRRTESFKRFATIFQPRGLEHQDEIGNRGLRIFVIELNEIWIERMREDNVRPFSLIESRGELTALTVRLYREFREFRCASNLAIEGLVMEMLACVCRRSRTLNKQPPLWLRRVLDMLNSDFHQKIKIDDLAKEVRVHPVYLSRVFRGFYHKGIIDYVYELRIKFTRQLLLDNNLSLAEIASAAGFADQSHFTRVFKAVTGLTPGQFRKLFGTSNG